MEKGLVNYFVISDASSTTAADSVSAGIEAMDDGYRLTFVGSRQNGMDSVTYTPGTEFFEKLEDLFKGILQVMIHVETNHLYISSDFKKAFIEQLCHFGFQVHSETKEGTIVSDGPELINYDNAPGI